MRITVFTPAYNRGYIIEKLYRSLQEQTYTEFEWLVIDDGSSDNTEELFRLWTVEKNPFPIRYYKIENGGKHRAINKATDLAEGELFFIVDSDDYLTKDALESIDNWERNLENKELFCGVSGNRGKQANEFLGTTFEGDYLDATSLERTKYNITGDKAEVFYTNILRKYKFHEFEGEKFISEATVWEKMAHDGYKIRWFNKTIYICDYLEDGLTNNMKEIFAKSPKGTAYYIKQQIKFYECNLKGRLSYYNLYYDFVKSNFKLRQAAEYLEIQPVTLIFSIFLVKCKKIIMSRF
ncbi:Glycosyltransferase involved in cell wall bisynthesis [Bacillus sp. 491mf]|uniref:glycosyltransferase family A protein n=1 Tax=Bacillus TaxID=1386 RepID=UPI000555C03D|nr:MULTISPECIES: glycosyltransferase family 2 protein [unclassified Bacillus (in: firmicutes)]SFC99813.1 Glycosyltransferase involved in cell wall bisynthesis [Bacillus sp. 491mf]